MIAIRPVETRDLAMLSVQDVPTLILHFLVVDVVAAVLELYLLSLSTRTCAISERIKCTA